MKIGKAYKKFGSSATESINHLKSAFLQLQSVVVKNNEVDESRVNVKITFEVK